MDCSLPGSSVMGFSRQEYWSGVYHLLLCLKYITDSLSVTTYSSIKMKEYQSHRLAVNPERNWMYKYTVRIHEQGVTHGRMPNNWCFRTVVLERILERPLAYQDIKLVNPKINRSWVFIGRTDAEGEAPICWPPDVKSLEKTLMLERWGQEEKRATEDELFGWHHRLTGHGSEQTPGDRKGQGGLVCRRAWGHRTTSRWHTCSLFSWLPLEHVKTG